MVFLLHIIRHYLTVILTIRQYLTIICLTKTLGGFVLEIVESKGLKLAIYIGKHFFDGQGENIVAVVKAADGEYVPHSNWNFDGTRRGYWMECFPNVKQVGDFICDWFSVTDNPDLIEATIYLHRKFKGEQIRKFLNSLYARDLEDITRFNDIFDMEEV